MDVKTGSIFPLHPGNTPQHQGQAHLTRIEKDIPSKWAEESSQCGQFSI